MNIAVYDQATVFEELQPEWNDLLSRSYANSLFSTLEWQSAWWAAYHPGSLFVITLRGEDSRLLGIAPWFIADTPKRGRVIRSIGCVEVTDYLDVIVDRDCIDPVLDGFAGYLAENAEKYDLLDLCNIPENSPTFDHFGTILTRRGFSVEIKQQEVCPVIELPDNWESYLETLNKKQRHELRRKLRRVDGAPEDVDWYLVDDTRDLGEEIERFMVLMAASDPQKAEFLSDEKNVAFFKTMIPVIYEKGWLMLNFLTVGGEAVAAYLNFDYNNRILVYNSGLRQETYGHLSPGIVLLAHNIRYAIDHKRTVFDFLRGNEIYKYRMGGVDTAVYMIMARLAS